MEVDQIIITLGVNKLRKVKIELKCENEVLTHAEGWTLSDAKKILEQNFPKIKDNYDLLNMLKY